MDSDDKKITQLTRVTSLSDSDLFVVVTNIGTSPVTKAIEKSNAITGGSGDTTPYRLSVVITANDLVVSLKDKNGSDPSVASPVKLQIGNAVREVTAALSITIPDGINYFNAGSAELGTQQIELFICAVWDSNSSVVALSATRCPWNANVSDYSSTTTSETHLFNHANFTSTDPVQVIGRTACILSLSGTSHLWTIPTLDDDNLIHREILQTRWLSWTPTRTGYSSVPTSIVYQYKMINDTCFIISRDGVDGTSNANTNQISLPFGATQTTNIAYQFVAAANNNSVTLTAYSYGAIFTPNWSTLIFGLDASFNSTAWAATNNKRIRTSTGFYKVK